MNNDHVVVTIARQYGSGGKTIGETLARDLGINCYDRELMRLASDESGIAEGLFGKADEKLKNSPLIRITKNVYKGVNDLLIEYDSKIGETIENLYKMVENLNEAAENMSESIEELGNVMQRA